MVQFWLTILANTDTAVKLVYKGFKKYNLNDSLRDLSTQEKGDENIVFCWSCHVQTEMEVLDSADYYLDTSPGSLLSLLFSSWVN